MSYFFFQISFVRRLGSYKRGGKGFKLFKTYIFNIPQWEAEVYNGVQQNVCMLKIILLNISLCVRNLENSTGFSGKEKEAGREEGRGKRN